MEASSLLLFKASTVSLKGLQFMQAYGAAGWSTSMAALIF